MEATPNPPPAIIWTESALQMVQRLLRELEQSPRVLYWGDESPHYSREQTRILRRRLGINGLLGVAVASAGWLGFLPAPWPFWSTMYVIGSMLFLLDLFSGKTGARSNAYYGRASFTPEGYWQLDMASRTLRLYRKGQLRQTHVLNEAFGLNQRLCSLFLTHASRGHVATLMDCYTNTHAAAAHLRLLSYRLAQRLQLRDVNQRIRPTTEAQLIANLHPLQGWRLQFAVAQWATGIVVVMMGLLILLQNGFDHKDNPVLAAPDAPPEVVQYTQVKTQARRIGGRGSNAMELRLVLLQPGRQQQWLSCEGLHDSFCRSRHSKPLQVNQLTLEVWRQYRPAVRVVRHIDYVDESGQRVQDSNTFSRERIHALAQEKSRRWMSITFWLLLTVALAVTLAKRYLNRLIAASDVATSDAVKKSHLPDTP
ncbi:MAG: hypothetical protein Q4G39_05170 [Brachymonas sp.]|nr:hypothetical protein [Brachymonas sp.]